MADTKPITEQFPETREFWSALREGRLLVKHCQKCDQSHFYPRVNCPFCGSADTRWLETSGRGTVYSFSIPRRAKPAIAPAVIELEGGLRLLSTIRDADVHGLRIGDDVVVHPQLSDARTDLAFTTVAAQAARAYAEKVSKDAGEVPGLAAGDPAAFRHAAVIGAGTMGIGITIALVNAGVSATLIDVDQAAVDKGMSRIAEQYDVSVQRKRLTPDQVAQRISLIKTSTDFSAISDADVIIEAVWEQMELKKSVFEKIDAHAKPGALLGTNTSGLDVNEIANATARPQDVIGLHFFTPAQSMKLLEVVRGRVTSDDSISRAMALGARLGKVSVLVETCSGFVGNRIFRPREAQARGMLLEGATPDQVDRVLVEFGMPMGSLELQDMTSGVELGYRKRQATGEKDWLGDRMFELGRVGQKAGKGFYRYAPGSRKPLADPELLALLVEGARANGIERRRLSDDEVRERLLLPMINEACRIIEEGVVARPTDVDAVWLNGYGWPAWRGGILYYADQIGARKVLERLRGLQAELGDAFKPSGLLKTLAERDGRFCDLPARRERSKVYSG